MKRSLTVAVFFRWEITRARGCEALSQKESEQFEQTVSQTQLALIIGVSTSRIRQLDKESAFVKVGRGKYDLPQSIQKYIDYQVEKAAGDDEDLNKLREETLWTRARRKKSEIEYKIMAGELHRSQDVEEVMNAMLASFRAQLLAFPTKAAPKVQGIKDIMAIKEALKKEVYELMEELSDYNPDVFYEKSKDKIFLEDASEQANEKK